MQEVRHNLLRKQTVLAEKTRVDVQPVYHFVIGQLANHSVGVNHPAAQRCQPVVPREDRKEQYPGLRQFGPKLFDYCLNSRGRLSDSAAVFLEGTGRYVNLKNWDVDNVYRTALGSETDTGTFWYIEEFEEDTGKYYPSLELSDEEPSDPDFRNVREAEIGLSGIVFKVGIKFSF